jgi:hypothetical protein
MSTLRTINVIHPSGSTTNIVNDSSGNVTVGNDLTVTGAMVPSSSFKRNRIINGNMLIDQRNAGASVTPTSTPTYTLDRWELNLSQPSKLSVQQNAGSVTPPAGFTKYLGITSLSAYSVSSTDNFRLDQPIEGLNLADLNWGTASAATVTVSFWVRSSLTGNFGFQLNNNAGTRSYPTTYAINAANTWEQKTITIPGDTTGTWETGNLTGVRVGFQLGYGSSLSGAGGAWNAGSPSAVTGAVSVVSTNGATFYITGVQLEVGTKATPYEMQIYSDQLAQCQRYYQKLYSLTGTTGNSTVNFYSNVQYIVPMRTTATISLSGVLNITDPAVASYTQSSAVVSVVGGQNTQGAYVSIQNFSGITAFRTLLANDFSNALIASAEL